MWRDIGDFLFGTLRLNVVLVVLMAPLIALCLGVVAPWRSFPTLIAVLWLTSPGLAVAFAAFRDSPAFGRSLLRRQAPAGSAMDSAADSYWRLDEDYAMVRPCVRALRGLWWRALLAAAPFAGAALVLCVDIVWLAGTGAGAYVAPALATTVLLVLLAWPVAIVVVTERPGVRTAAVLRLALTLVVRRWYFSLLNLLVMLGIFFGLVAQPFLMAAVGNGFLLHLLWANARWMVLPSITPEAADAVRSPAVGRLCYGR
ncbi:hypothetical protein [Actinomyces glycerinitolerans]|uniref:DUF624 domain-containing protein n=1 Tax=Actinomyces glycerinitolerans TaxID=1892869 RepID=A0A1M4S3E3_9ACTO|nr:hypothetical protein [Actinomyces glycerinitolerans]SHE26725.1 Hypothetical protein ACGLYG10_2979 [Actinomyces glycerinitolerans]